MIIIIIITIIIMINNSQISKAPYGCDFRSTGGTSRHCQNRNVISRDLKVPNKSLPLTVFGKKYSPCAELKSRKHIWQKAIRTNSLDKTGFFVLFSTCCVTVQLQGPHNYIITLNRITFMWQWHEFLWHHLFVMKIVKL